ncbi:MAG: 30S ribosomal protein S15 [Gammaproteobacteria bacterium]|nr:30S ribosomal protein S15 [Gammaproteobacteria bacterium]
MSLSTAQKAEIVKTHQQKGNNDTGSSEVQIALLTARINALTEHLKIHKHDFHTRFGLTKMVSQRRKLMRYLKNTNSPRYLSIIKALDIRGLS